MSGHHPMDPYAWRESVLSIRSLSYISNTGGLAHLPSNIDPNQTHLRTPSTHRSTITDCSDEDEDLDMEDAKPQAQTSLKNIPELPESVAYSLLFELPREIRDRIYSFCLTAQHGVPVDWPAEANARHALDIHPKLLRTCRIVHDEATPLLYSLNRLSFAHPSDANMFVRVMASRAHASRHLAHLSLHVKAQDLRIWMPYLTSSHIHRSLKADFPALRELSVRFRSNRWVNTLPPEVNLRNWAEDMRLDELINGLRHVYLPPHISKQDTRAAVARHGRHEWDSEAEIGASMGRAFGLLPKREDTHTQEDMSEGPRPRKPRMRVCCVCRVHAAQFQALTNPIHPTPTPASDGEPGRFVPHVQIPPPHYEGEPYRGFNPIDLQMGLTKAADSDPASSLVAHTPFADKDGILLALEIHCLDPRRDGA